MTENIKKLAELASQDEKLRKALCEAPDTKSIISLAAEHGLTLTEEDVKMHASKEQELDEEELASVVGGEYCFCPLAGGGLKTGKTETPCGCVIYGVGYYYKGSFGKLGRCDCIFGGSGMVCN